MGGILFLLPFFCNPWGGVMTMQFDVPKLIAALVLGSVCLSFLAGSYIHWAFGVAHLAISLSVVLTGFGAMQMYPLAYWIAAMSLGLWIIKQPFPVQNFIWKCVALSGIIAAAHALLQMLGVSWPLTYAKGINANLPIALIGQHTKLGAFLAPCAAVALALGWIPACIFISLIAVATKSSFTVFSLVIGLGVVFSVKRGLSAKPVVAVLVLGVSMALMGPLIKEYVPALNDNGRSLVYRDTIKAWSERPLFGYGPGGFQALFAGPIRNRVQWPPKKEFFKESFQAEDTYEAGGGWYENPHNDYLLVLFDMGLLGFLSILLIVFAIIKAYAKEWAAFRFGWAGNKSLLCAMGSLASLMTNALGNFPWILSPHFMIGAMACAILLRASRA